MRRKRIINITVPRLLPITKRAEKGTAAKEGGGTIIHANIKTNAAKCIWLMVVAAKGMPLDTAVPTSNMEFPKIASTEAVQVILYPCLKAANPKGTRKKKDRRILRCSAIQIPAAIKAGM